MKFGCRTVVVTQEVKDFDRALAYRRRTAAFEEWREKLLRGDRLPRGRYFKGKTAGRNSILILDECHLLSPIPPRHLAGW